MGSKIIQNVQVSLVALQELKARPILKIKYKLTFRHLESLKINSDSLGIKRKAYEWGLEIYF